MKSSKTSLEHEVALRHRQDIRRFAGQEHAIGGHGIGFRVDPELGRRAIVNHAFLADAAARVLNGDHGFRRAQLRRKTLV